MARKKKIKQEVKALSPEEETAKVEASSELVTREVPILDAKGKVVVRLRRSRAGPRSVKRAGHLHFFDKKTAKALVANGSAIMIDPSRDLTVNQVFELNHRVLTGKV